MEEVNETCRPRAEVSRPGTTCRRARFGLGCIRILSTLQPQQEDQDEPEPNLRGDDFGLGIVRHFFPGPNCQPVVGRSVNGDPFSDASYVRRQVTAVCVRSGTSVHSIRFMYGEDGPMHGGNGGWLHSEAIASDEFIGGVTVTYDGLVDSVGFHIFRRVEGGDPALVRSTERFGDDSTYKRTIMAPAGCEIYGSYGQAGFADRGMVDQVGFLFRPLP